MTTKIIRSIVVILISLLMLTVAFAEDTANRAITLESNEIMLYKGDKFTATATITLLNEDAPKKTSLVWETSDKAVVTVSNKGVITAKEAGTATITCFAKDDPTISSQITVNVVLPVTKVVPEEEKITILLGAEGVPVTYQASAHVQPENAHCTDLVWSSNKETVAIVDQNGCITAHAKGNATITVQSAENRNGKKAVKTTITVTVVQGVTSIEQGSTSVSVDIGKTVKLSATALPKDAKNRKVTWTSSNPAIATVSSGTVKGVSKGTCTITATAADGSGVSVSYTITVNQPVQSLKATETKLTVFAKGTIKPSVTITPSNASNKTLQWKSSDTSIAVVNQEGVITGKRAGKCTITCTTTDGSNKSTKFTVTVKNLAGSTVYFGRFEQDGNTSNGKEAIAWRVLSVSGNTVLLISDKGLHAMHYESESFETGVTWGNSDIRNWLNNSFYNSAFNTKEKEAILNTNTQVYDVSASQQTTDKVFILTRGEANNYFKNNSDLVCKATKSAQAILKRESPEFLKSNGVSAWWMRDKTQNAYNAGVFNFNLNAHKLNAFAAVDRGNGYKSAYSSMVLMVRPCVNVDLNQLLSLAHP